MSRDDDSSDIPRKSGYEVGYGRPPREHRFKPGNSGNRTGRKKGSRNVKTLLAEEMKSRIDIKINGRARRLTKAEAIVKLTAQKALSGDDRSMDRLYRLLDQYKLIEDIIEPVASPAFHPGNLTEEERATLRRLLEKIRQPVKKLDPQ